MHRLRRDRPAPVSRHVTTAEVARAVTAIHGADPGARALERRQRRQLINPTRINRKAIARYLGISNKAARKAIRRWRREAIEVAQTSAMVAAVSTRAEAEDRGMVT